MADLQFSILCKMSNFFPEQAIDHLVELVAGLYLKGLLQLETIAFFIEIVL